MTRSKTTFTRRNGLVASGILGLGASLGWVPAGTFAHQGEGDDPLAGATIETLSAGAPDVISDRMLVLMRVTMEPGTIIPSHSHPGPVALYVESGIFGTEFFEGKGTVQPAPRDGTPVRAIELAPGDDVQMPAGDHLFYDGAVHTMRNDGDDTLVLLVSALLDPEASGFQWSDQGTPSS